MHAIDRSAQTNRWRKKPASAKLLVSIGLMAMSLGLPGWSAQVSVLLAALGLVVFGAGVAPRDLAHAFAVPFGFILTGAVAQMLTLDHHGWVPLIGLQGAEGLAKAGFVSFRSLACVAALLMLALTTPLTSLLQLFQRLGLNADISDIAMIMVRMIWLTLDCLESGSRSISARLGYTSRRRMLSSSALLGASLLPRVLSRAQRMETGLAARGYGGRLAFLSVEEQASSASLGMIALGLLSLTFLLAWFP